MLSGQGTPPVPGQIVQGVATLRVPRGADLPGSFDYREFLAGRGLHWQGQLEETPVSGELTGPGSLLVEYLGSARTWVRRGLERLLPAREAELSGAVLLGTRTAGSRQGAEPFADLGLAHLFAVSGLHVGILLGIVVLPGRALGLSATWRFLPLLFFLPVYAALTGLPGSVVRAAGLALLAGGAGALGRRGNSLHLLGLLFWGTTLWHPAQVLDTGVRLSYLAAGGIITVMGLLRPVISGGGRWSWLVTALAVSLAAQWFTLPQAAMSFGRFSVLSPAANLVAVPLFGLGVWAVVLALIIGTAVPWLAQSVAALGWLVLRGLSGVVALVSGGTGGLNLGLAPTSVINGLFWVLLTVTLLGMLRRLSNGEGQARLRSLAVILGILVLGHGVFAWNGFMLAGNGTMRVWQFDVGQGDCALVVFPDRWTCLVDAGGVFGRGMGPPDGPVRRSVIPYLKRAWVKKLDAVVLGHGHLDHTGGVPSLQEEMTIGHWWTGGDAARDVAGIIPEGRTTIVEKPVILHRQGPWTLEILYPAEGLPADFHENDRSLVMVLRHGDRPCMVWSGDLETHGERHLLETMADLPEKTQVWKAGHHGSNTSGSRNWLDRLDPGLVIISCGAGNKYGHPNHGWYTIEQDTLPTLRTDLEGSILLEWDSEGSLRWVSRALEGHLAALP
jgi:competence protein ComEC